MFRMLSNIMVAATLLWSTVASGADSSKPGYTLEALSPYSVRVLRNSCDGKLYGAGCTASPVASGTMSVACGTAEYKLTEPLQGVFTLPSSRIGYLENLGKKTDIVWEYEGARITTASNSTPEEKRQTIKMYLDKLAAEKLLTLQLGEHSDFDRSGTILFDKIRSSLPKYYRLTRSARQASQAPETRGIEIQEDSATYDLVPHQSRMFYKYGDYTGVVDLAAMAFSDVPAPVVLKTSIINNVLPSFLNGDNNVKVAFKDSVLHVTSTSESPLTLKMITLYYDGKFFDGILDHPAELAPAATVDISLASIIEKDLKLDEKHSEMTAQEAWQKKVSYGFGVIYGKDQNSARTLLSKAATYSAYEPTEDAVETARLAEHLKSLVSAETAAKVDVPSEVRYDLTIEFASGKVVLNPVHQDRLDAAGKAMKSNLSITGVIEGHSDNVGSKAANRRISEQRAIRAKQYLVKKYSINPARIQTKGFGMTKPIADNGTSAGRMKNRRIEAKFCGTGIKAE